MKMPRTHAALACALALACAERGAAPAVPSAADAAAPAPGPSPAPAGAASTAQPAAAPPVQAGEAQPVASHVPRPRPPFPAGHSSITGCLGAAGEGEAARFPARPVTRSGPHERLEANPVQGGVVVVHDLDHACCLRGEVTTTVQAARATVREVLSGTPCRCMCSSILRTEVRLPPGPATLVVDLEVNGRVRRVLERHIEVAP